MPTAIILVLGVIVGLVVAISNGGSSKKTPQSSGEIFLQPAGAPGPDSFGPSIASPITPNPSVSASVFPSAIPTSGSSAPTSGPLVLTAQSGGTPELYGGSKRLSVCDKASMISFLQANPEKAAAWAAVQGISASELPSFIDALTPVVLRTDTRVTNHGFRNGHANPFQAVLQAGTAVLVDEHGVPRARCACGNPLAPPVAVPTTPKYTGPAWPGFTPTNVTVINKSTTIIKVIIVIDIETAQPVGIPVNPSTTTPPTSTSASAPPTSSPPTAGSGWKLVTVKPVPLLGQPDYRISMPWTATGGGVTITMHDDGTLCGGSGGTETVSYQWGFSKDVTTLANGDSFQARTDASKVSSSGTCTTGGLAARSSYIISGIGGGSLPLTAFDRTPETDRFGGTTIGASADPSLGVQQTSFGIISVGTTPSDPAKPEAGFEVTFGGPGYEFYALYIYEQN